MNRIALAYNSAINKVRILLNVAALIATTASLARNYDVDIESTFYLKGAIGGNIALSQQDPLLDTRLEAPSVLSATVAVGAYLSPFIRAEIGGIYNFGDLRLISQRIKVLGRTTTAKHDFTFSTGYIRTYLDFPTESTKVFIGGGPTFSRMRENISYEFSKSEPSERKSTELTASSVGGAVSSTNLGFNISGGFELSFNEEVSTYIELQYNYYGYYGKIPAGGHATNTERIRIKDLANCSIENLSSIVINIGIIVSLG